MEVTWELLDAERSRQPHPVRGRARGLLDVDHGTSVRDVLQHGRAQAATGFRIGPGAIGMCSALPNPTTRGGIRALPDGLSTPRDSTGQSGKSSALSPAQARCGRFSPAPRRQVTKVSGIDGIAHHQAPLCFDGLPSSRSVWVITTTGNASKLLRDTTRRPASHPFMKFEGLSQSTRAHDRSRHQPAQAVKYVLTSKS